MFVFEVTLGPNLKNKIIRRGIYTTLTNFSVSKVRCRTGALVKTTAQHGESHWFEPVSGLIFFLFFPPNFAKGCAVGAVRVDAVSLDGS